MSAYKGVTFLKDTRCNPWCAFIWLEGKQHQIGVYHGEIEAARAYDAKAREVLFSAIVPDMTQLELLQSAA